MNRYVVQARAVVVLTLARVLLRRRGTTDALRALTSRRSWSPSVDPDRSLRAVQRAARVVGGACLPQAVALAALLQRDGFDPVLVLGCRREDDRSWTAHAWVLLEGEKLEPLRANKHEALAYLGAETGWKPAASY